MDFIFQIYQWGKRIHIIKNGRCRESSGTEVEIHTNCLLGDWL